MSDEYDQQDDALGGTTLGGNEEEFDPEKEDLDIEEGMGDDFGDEVEE